MPTGIKLYFENVISGGISIKFERPWESISTSSLVGTTYCP